MAKQRAYEVTHRVSLIISEIVTAETAAEAIAKAKAGVDVAPLDSEVDHDRPGTDYRARLDRAL